MPLPLNAQVKVRVQARDGKILGPAVKTPVLSVRDVLKNKMWITDEPMKQGSSGTVVPVASFSDVVSRNAIVLQSSLGPTYPAGPYWLQPPGNGQGELIVQLPLTEPSLLEFTATAYAPDPVYASATMWVMPGMQLVADPGLVLTIAGLYATVQATPQRGAVSFTANVTMMCGCPITIQPSKPLPPNTEPEPYWPSDEFEVWADVRPRDPLQEAVSFRLACTDTSTFTRLWSLARGTYDVWLVAVQLKETNVGFASTTLVVPSAVGPRACSIA